MSRSSQAPSPPDHILPVGDRQLERIRPDEALTVRIRPIGGSGQAAELAAHVVDLSLHGLLITALPSLAQGTLVDIIDLEPEPVRARVVRQSDLGTHVSFVDHLHPRYRKSRTAGQPADPNRRRFPRVPCESAATVDAAMATVLNASLGGVLVRVSAPAQWSLGDRVTVTIDAHKEALTGKVVAISDDRVSIRFLRTQSQLRVTAADCIITLEQQPARRASSPKKAAAKKPAAKRAPGKPAPAKRAARKKPPGGAKVRRR